MAELKIAVIVFAIKSLNSTQPVGAGIGFIRIHGTKLLRIESMRAHSCRVAWIKEYDMSKTLSTLLAFLVLASLVLSACGGVASPATTLDPALARQATLVLANGSEESVFVSQTFSLPAGNWTFTRLIPTTATAEVLAQRALWILSDQVLVPMFLALDIAVNPQADAMTTFAENPTFDNFLKTIGPNIVQQQAEGPQTLFLGDRLMIANADGSITTVQLANPDTAQELAEGKTDVNARSQCQETGENCQATPGPTKYAAVFGDEKDSVIVAVLGLWNFQGTLFLDEATLLASPATYDLIIIRAGQPEGWRLASIPAVKARWPMAKVVVTSGGAYEAKAKEMGADGFHASETGPETLKTLLQSIGAIP